MVTPFAKRVELRFFTESVHEVKRSCRVEKRR